MTLEGEKQHWTWCALERFFPHFFDQQDKDCIFENMGESNAFLPMVWSFAVDLSLVMIGYQIITFFNLGHLVSDPVLFNLAAGLMSVPAVALYYYYTRFSNAKSTVKSSHSL